MESNAEPTRVFGCDRPGMDTLALNTLYSLVFLCIYKGGFTRLSSKESRKMSE